MRNEIIFFVTYYLGLRVLQPKCKECKNSKECTTRCLKTLEWANIKVPPLSCIPKPLHSCCFFMLFHLVDLVLKSLEGTEIVIIDVNNFTSSVLFVFLFQFGLKEYVLQDPDPDVHLMSLQFEFLDRLLDLYKGG